MATETRCGYRWPILDPNAEDVALGRVHVCGLPEGHASRHRCSHDGAMAANEDEVEP